MTLADILKPSITVITHAEVKGLQVGAGLGTLAAIPALLIRPSLINPNDEPPLVAVANIAGIGAVTGATAVTLACAYKMSKLSREGIVERAEKIMANKEQRKLDYVAATSAALGVGLVGARVAAISKNQGKCVFGLLFRKQTAWETFAFGVMGAAVGVGIFVIGGKVYAKIDARRKGDEGVNEIDEGNAEDAVKAVVEESVKDAVDNEKM